MKKTLMSQLLFIFALSSCWIGYAAAVETGKTITVYTARKDQLIKPIFDKYTEKTGVKIDYFTSKAPVLLAKLKFEGENTPADVLLTVDAGNLWHAAKEDVLATVNSSTLEQDVPAHLRDPENRWFGLSVRARTLVYSKSRVKASELSTYEALSDEPWKGRLCLRTSKKVYNQSLVATMIARLGEGQTEKIVEGWVDNLATEVFGSDTQLLEAIDAGQCDVGIVNTYYAARLLKKNPDADIGVFWPNQTDRGVHVNISGAGVTKHAPHKEEAIKFVEWLASEEAQKEFAGINYEYPVNTNVEDHPMVARWGEFKPDTINVVEAGKRQVSAVKLMDRVGYN